MLQPLAQHSWEQMLFLLPESFRKLAYYGSFYRDAKGDLVFKEYHIDQERWENRLLNEDEKVAFSRMRKKGTSFSWNDQSAYTLNQSDSLQGLESELKKTVLVIALQETNDHHSNLIFLSFQKGIKHFLPSKDSEVLSTENKAIVGNLILNQLSQHLQTVRAFQDNFSPIQHSFSRAEHKINELKEVNAEHEKQRKDYIRLLCHEWLRKEGDRHDGEFRLDEDAIQSLLDAGVGLAMMEKVLERAASILTTIHPHEEILTIQEHHLDWEKDQSVTPVKRLPKKDKTIDLLDRYESVAIQLQQSGEKVTGKAIAENLRPSVSPPAITDAVKKHKKSIAFLLDRYPNRWSTIREYLSPVKKIEGELRQVG